MDVIEAMRSAVGARELATAESPIVLMVSGGSDSTALAYAATQLRDEGTVGPLCILHVNHCLRGADADADQEFTEQLAGLLDVPFTCARVDVAGMADAEKGNIEAIARRERYAAARAALSDACQKQGVPVSSGRIFVAHTADDRVENFYMRSIVGTGPGGFRSMLYLNGQVARPLLDCGREDLRAYITARIEDGLPVARDANGMLWREDATNEHTDRFRAFVRHEIVPLAKERNPQLLDTLTRSMNLIGDEDDMLDQIARGLAYHHVAWLQPAQEGCVIGPELATERMPLQRRVAMLVLEDLLGADARIDTATVEAVLAGFKDGKPNSGYVANVQGNLAISANKHGVRIEPMAVFRTRRKK